MLKKMKNYEIYDCCELLNSFFEDQRMQQIYMPAKLNFYLQKNKNSLRDLYKSIISTRQDILLHYGTHDDNNNYHFKKEDIDIVNQELQDLLNIEQEVEIILIKLSDLENLEFTLEQMEALMFMIEED